jgi:sec-independent protein translocase protein TatB
MFDIGFGEMLLIAVIALIAIGPKQLPEVARVIGRTLNEFRRASTDFTRSLADARDTIDRNVNEMNESLQKSMEQVISPTTSSGEHVPSPLDALHPPSASPGVDSTAHQTAADEQNQMSFDMANSTNPAATHVATGSESLETSAAPETHVDPHSESASSKPSRDS